MARGRIGNPLKSEDAAFRLLLVVAAVAGIVIALILLGRALF